MAKKRAVKKKKKTCPSGGGRKKPKPNVWHIFHFEERFELADDMRTCRRGPLIYIREYIGTGSDDEQINYRQQIQRIKMHEERHLLRSVFVELREIAACRSRAYRGYLLDERLRPATTRWLAGMCRVEVKKMTRVMKELAAVGLIEQVPLPEFDLDLNEVPESGKKKKRKQASKGAMDAKKSNPRKSSEISGEFWKPLKNKDTEKGNQKSKENKKKNPVQKKPEQDTESEGNAQGQRKQTPAAPATTPNLSLNNLTGSDAGSGNPCGLLYPSSVGISHIGKVIAGTRLVNQVEVEDALSSLPESRRFALSVYGELQLQWPKGHKVFNQIIGAFVAAWDKALSADISEADRTDLWNKSIKEAQKICRNKRRCNDPAAVWNAVFKRRLEARKVG